MGIVDEEGIGVRVGDCSVFGFEGIGGAGLRWVDVLVERRDVVDDTEGERDGRRGGRGSVLVEVFAKGGGSLRAIGCCAVVWVRTDCEREGSAGCVDAETLGVRTGRSTLTQSGSLVGANGFDGRSGFAV